MTEQTERQTLSVLPPVSGPSAAGQMSSFPLILPQKPSCDVCEGGSCSGLSFKNPFVDAQSPPSVLLLEEYQQQKDKKRMSQFDVLSYQRRSQRQALRHQQLNTTS